MTGQKIKEIVVYKGETFICVGTLKECSEMTGFSEYTLRRWLKPSYHKKNEGRENEIYLAYRVDDTEGVLI